MTLAINVKFCNGNFNDIYFPAIIAITIFRVSRHFKYGRFPRIGFIVTNLNWQSKSVVRFYNKRGIAEQWIKEGKLALNWTRLSCPAFRDNKVRLQLFALASNLGNFLRRLALPRKHKHWTLTTLQEKLIEIGMKVIRHARYLTFQLAEVAVPRELFETILKKIDRLRLLPETGSA